MTMGTANTVNLVATTKSTTGSTINTAITMNTTIQECRSFQTNIDLTDTLLRGLRS